MCLSTLKGKSKTAAMTLLKVVKVIEVAPEGLIQYQSAHVQSHAALVMECSRRLVPTQEL